MKILAIGNSFSSDATHYLHQIARADGFELNVVNLYIGGCPLSYHYSNLLSGEKRYDLEFNGVYTGFKVSIKDALESGSWTPFDAVTLQQASHLSFNPDTYHPYLEMLAETIRVHQPKTRLMIHQTWAYRKDSDKLAAMQFSSPEEMFDAIRKAYDLAAESVKADGIIPCGTAFRKLMEKGVYDIHRDDFHASKGFGRYVLALTWYETLTGRTCIGNSFRDFDEEVSEVQVALAQQVAHVAAQEFIIK